MANRSMTVKLIYLASRCGRPHVAEAIVECRLTAKQIVVDANSVKHLSITYVSGHTRGPTGIGAVRYWRHNGRRVGGDPMRTSWQLAPGELPRLNNAKPESSVGR